MLEFMRRKAQSTVIQVTILAIILVFVFWGVGTNRGNKLNAAATVNDEPISYQEFQRTYNKKIDELRKQLGGSIPDGLLQTLGVKQQVLDQLIQQTLIRQGGAEIGLMVSDPEVRKAIQAMDAFKNNGTFDLSWYKQILTGNRMTSEQFEASMKTDLLTAKVLDHLSRFAEISEAELAERIDFEYRQKQFSYVVIEAKDFEKKVEVKDDELAAFFNEKKEGYKTAPEVKLDYIRFSYADAGKIDIPDSDVESYYERNKDQYVIPEKRRASHILIKIAEGDSDEQIAEKRKKAEGLLKKIREGADFASLARKDSDDKGSATRGGDLGFFGRGQMVKPFEDAVFGLEEGGLTMTRSRFGFHVIRLDAIKPLQVKTLDEVRAEIVEKIRKEKAKDLVADQANDAYKNIILAGSLAKYAESGGVEVKETDFFSRAQPAKGFAGDPEFLAAAFALKKGELSSLVQGRDGFVILFAKDVKAPVIPELAEVREKVVKDYVALRATELARKAAEDMLANLKDGATLESAAGSLGAEIQTSPFLSRANRNGTKLSPAVIDSGLALTPKVKFPENIVAEGSGFYVLEFKDEKEVSADLSQEKKDEIRNKLLAENRSAELKSWIAYLRDRAEITIDEKF